jgi:hypothetical protein
MDYLEEGEKRRKGLIKVSMTRYIACIHKLAKRREIVCNNFAYNHMRS